MWVVLFLALPPHFFLIFSIFSPFLPVGFVAAAPKPPKLNRKTFLFPKKVFERTYVVNGTDKLQRRQTLHSSTPSPCFLVLHANVDFRQNRSQNGDLDIWDFSGSKFCFPTYGTCIAG